MVKKGETETVLIIEDEADIQQFASRVLELEGYHVLKANDGERGMEIMRANSVALVLLDLRLPGRDGWSVLHEIKHDTYLSKTPVIVITAVADFDDVISTVGVLAMTNTSSATVAWVILKSTVNVMLALSLMTSLTILVKPAISAETVYGPGCNDTNL